MNEDFDAKLMANARARAKAAEAENARLKARLAELQKENDKPSDAPAVPNSSEEEDEASGPWEIDPQTGKLRRVKKAVDEKPDEQQQEEARAKAAALLVINAYRNANGLPLVSRLIQDESAIPAGIAIDHRDSEIFARAVVAAHRRATGLPPLAQGEWVSIKRLRGEG